MSMMVTEIYDALKKAGVDEETARAAAKAVIGAEEKERLATKADVHELRLATKADLAELRREMAGLKSEVIQWNVGAMAVLTAIFAALDLTDTP